MRVARAPEPRAILWENIHLSSSERRTRTLVANAFSCALIAFYAVPITLLQLLVSDTALIARSPTLATLAISSKLFAGLLSSIQPLCIVLLQQLLPPLFNLVGVLEGHLSFDQVLLASLRRYYMFLVVNIFLVSAVASTFYETARLIAANPGMAFTLLGYSLPRTSSFFVYYLAIR